MSEGAERCQVEDPIDLLMPDAAPHDQDVMRRLAVAFRLAAIETADARSPSTGVESKVALEALREHDLAEALLALDDLMVHHAAPCRGEASFAVLPRPRATYTETLRSLLKLLGRRSAELNFELPPPEASPRAALRALLSVMEAWVQHPEVRQAQLGGARLWEARRLRYDGDHEAARRLLEELLAIHAGANDRRTRELRAEVLAELVSIHLDVGALIEARAAVLRGGPSPKLAADVRGNLDVLALVLTWLEGEESLPALEDVFLRTGFDVPSAWQEALARVELRDPVAQRFPLPSGDPRGGRRRRDLPSRAELRAQAVVFLVLDDGGRLRRESADVAPGLENALDDWGRRCRQADSEQGSVQQEALRGGVPVFMVSGAARPSVDDRIRRSCIDAACSCPMAAVALPVQQGDELVGLIWLEFSRRWLPGDSELRSVCEAAIGHPLLRHRVGASVRLTVEDGDPAGLELRSARDDLRRLWIELVEDLELKTAERRWVALQRMDHSGDLAPVASGGAGIGRLQDPSPSGLWAIRRVLGAGGFVRYEGDPGDEGSSMLHPGAAVGIAIAVPGLFGVEAVLVIESARRGDSRERDAVRWSKRLEDKASVIQCAALDLQDRVSHGGGFVLDGLAADEQQRLGRIQTLASSRTDLIIRGEAASGRRTMARAVHHARRPRGARVQIIQLSSFGLEVEDLERAFTDPSVETVVVADVEYLDVACQVALARILDRPLPERPRMVATGRVESGLDVDSSSDPGAEAHPSDRSHHPDLYRNLERVEVAAPALRHVRHRIPALARSLARRWERSARPGDPMLWSEASDEVESILWRQPWRGNAVELEAVVRQALLRAGGAPVGARHLELAFGDVGLEVLPRLPSRSPDLLDVASAVWTTRTATGRMNKTRAAAFCGWDPNTLAARLRGMEISQLEDVQRLLRVTPLS